MKIIDAIGVALIVVGIVMTVTTFLAPHRPIPDAGPVTVQEPQSPRSEFAPRGVGGNPSASSGQVI